MTLSKIQNFQKPHIIFITTHPDNLKPGTQLLHIPYNKIKSMELYAFQEFHGLTAYLQGRPKE